MINVFCCSLFFLFLPFFYDFLGVIAVLLFRYIGMTLYRLLRGMSPPINTSIHLGSISCRGNTQSGEKVY